MSESRRVKCKCGHVGTMTEEGEFSCNVCQGRGRIPEPWPGKEAIYRAPEQISYYSRSYNYLTPDPAWWEDEYK